MNKLNLALTSATLALVTTPLWAAPAPMPAGPSYPPYPPGPYGYWWGYHPHFFFPIFGILIFFLLLRWVMWGGSWRHARWHRYAHNDALDVLEERFAKGEIGKEEFEEKRKLLRRGRF